MPLLNYTTTIAVEKTLAEIQRMLAKHGASSILVTYEDGEPTGLSFLIKTNFGDRGYRLPADIEAVFTVLQDQWRAGAIQKRFVCTEQAARVGWRIIKDWVEAQLAIIETEMVSLDQVFLPYMQVDNGLSLYEAMVEHHLALPSGNDTDESNDET